MAHRLLKGRPNMNARSGQRGYSLAEMLTVVAIIGITSLIVVPNFVQYYRAIRLKTAMRRFASDLRAARQRAVSRNEMVMISYKPDVAPATYSTYESLDSGTTWTQLGSNVTLDKPISLSDSSDATLKLTDAYQGDGLSDAIFKSDGTAVLPATVTTGQITIKTAEKIAVPNYTITITSTGKISAQ